MGLKAELSYIKTLFRKFDSDGDEKDKSKNE